MIGDFYCRCGRAFRRAALVSDHETTCSFYRSTTARGPEHTHDCRTCKRRWVCRQVGCVGDPDEACVRCMEKGLVAA